MNGTFSSHDYAHYSSAIAADVLRRCERPRRDFSIEWLGVPNEPQNCEMNLQDLEHARNLARPETYGYLIIVARLGDGERRKELNFRRLYNARLQLTRIGVPSDKIVIAEGERVKGLGRVELYVRGEFIGALPVRRGADICVGCCGPDENFYPYRQDNRRNATGGAQPVKGMNRTRN